MKACPFCGSENIKTEIRLTGICMILCYGHGCGATVSFFENETTEKAVEAWNNRIVDINFKKQKKGIYNA